MNFDLKTAFVLAAGKGERLRPYTEKTPKPLLPVHGGTLLERNLWNLVPLVKNFGMERVVVNAWYLKEQIVQFVRSSAERFPFEIVVSEETDLLGTGGGLKQGLRYFQNPKSSFLMMNADCLWEGDLSGFIKFSLNVDAEVSWWMADFQRDQTEILVHRDQVVRIGNLWDNLPLGCFESLCFSGIQLFRSVESESLPAKGCILRDYLIPRLRSGMKLGAETKLLQNWQDLGTPERYLQFL